MSPKRCPLCKGHMLPGTTTLTLRKERSVVVIEAVPALVCEHCDEASVDAETAQVAYDLAQREIDKGVALEFCTFAA